VDVIIPFNILELFESNQALVWVNLDLLIEFGNVLNAMKESKSTWWWWDLSSACGKAHSFCGDPKLCVH
jgi:hypothetical protein